MASEGNKTRVARVVGGAWRDVMNNHVMTMSAGLSYYFVLSLFPLLILAASALAYLPIPNLFDTLLASMARVVPPQSMGLVRRVVATVVQPHSGLLTFGILGTLWTASSGFAALIEALNVAYDVPETRSLWRTRLLAVALMFIIGGLLFAALVLMVVGPIAVQWISGRLGVGWLMAIWPYAKWSASIVFTVLGVELLFFWAPNVRQHFLSTLPGAVIGVAFFIVSSYGLGLYFQNFANYNKTYGVLGAAMALMVWLYYSWFMILIGAEINSELVKMTTGGRLLLKGKPPVAVEPVPPWKEHPAA